MIEQQGERTSNIQPDYAKSGQHRRTLGLTGITINAMALIAPGALMWLLYQAQAASVIAGSADIWPGVLAALLVAILTTRSLSELAQRYPDAGQRGAYHFITPILSEKTPYREAAQPSEAGWISVAKFATGWSANLYYWVYPGIMVAFITLLADDLLRRFGYHPTVFGLLILTFSISALIGFLAMRGITGSTTSSIVLNVIQLVTLLLFGGAAILFRTLNPLHIVASGWAFPDVVAILVPKTLGGLVFQTALAIVLMIGFEDASALSTSANNPVRDLPRATVLALLIQGALAYLLQYFAAGLALNEQLGMVVQSRNPIGDLAYQLGNVLLAGNGSTILLTMGFTILIALLGSAMTALNTGVRISFSMGIDPNIPSIPGLLPAQFATPYHMVVMLCGASALIGSIATIGGLPAMLSILLVTGLGALVMYGLLCVLTIVAFAGSPQFNLLRHGVLPGLGALVNFAIAAAFPVIGLRAGGVPAQATLLALAIAMLWLVVCAVYQVMRARRS